jgi:uncharacterized membrane protein (UPF0127 family)
MVWRTSVSASMKAQPISAVNVTRGICLADRVERADTFLTRLKGLIGRDSLSAGRGLLLSHCSSVHTLGMAFPIDVLHLDRRNVVKAIVRDRAPWRLGPWVIGGASVLELPAGGAGSTQVGDTIELRESRHPDRQIDVNSATSGLP